MPESFIRRTRAKLRYYRAGLPFWGMGCRVIIDGLAKVGIIISPHYVVVEGLDNGRLQHLAEGFADYQFGFLGPQDMKALANLPGRIFTGKELLGRLHEGQKCFAAKRRGEIVAFTWCSFAPYAFAKQQALPLRSNEAYLFDAHTVEQYRGIGIAPTLRYRCYQELAKMGRTRCYSITAAFNMPAINFKKKLHAQVLELGLFVELWGRWWWHTRLQDYREQPQYQR
jgi:hypothetical protein